jgi:hypothetical protein
MVLDILLSPVLRETISIGPAADDTLNAEMLVMPTTSGAAFC